MSVHDKSKRYTYAKHIIKVPVIPQIIVYFITVHDKSKRYTYAKQIIKVPVISPLTGRQRVVPNSKVVLIVDWSNYLVILKAEFDVLYL
mgnify:FL=1